MQRRRFMSALMGLAGFCLPASAKKTHFVKEVLLLDCFVAGYQFYQGENVQQQFSPGDLLSLQAEPENSYDDLAVEVYWRHTKLGYVPRCYNGVIAQLLQRQQKMVVTIAHLDIMQPTWRRLKFNVFLG